MPAAIAVPLIVGGASAAATVYGANKASSAAKNAAKVQTDSGNQALALQRDIYNTNRADDAPYRQMGAGALQTLGNMTGIPMGGGSMNVGGPMPQGGPQGNGLTLSNMGGYGQPGGGQTPQAGMVLMQAPNGQTKRVPEAAAAHYEQLGARRVG